MHARLLDLAEAADKLGASFPVGEAAADATARWWREAFALADLVDDQARGALATVLTVAEKAAINAALPDIRTAASNVQNGCDAPTAQPGLTAMAAVLREVARRLVAPAADPESHSAYRRRVFVSQATVDEDLVDALLDLLQLGVGLGHRDVFCTSRKGDSPPLGRAFTPEIRLQLEHATCVIAVLTKAYWESPFCIGELGAAWYDRRKLLVPLLVPPLTFNDLRGVANKTEALFVNDSEQLDRLRDAVIQKLGMGEEAVPTATWNRKKEAFLKILNGILTRTQPEAQAPPPGDEAPGESVEDKQLAQRMMREFQALNRGPKVSFHTDQQTRNAGVPYLVRFNGDRYEARELLSLFGQIVTEASSSDDDLSFWRLLSAARKLRVATWELLKRPDWTAWKKDEWLTIAERFAALEQAHGETVRRFWDEPDDVGAREVSVYVYDGGEFLGTATYIPPGCPNGAPDPEEGLLMGAPPSVQNNGRYTIEDSGRRIAFVAHGSAGGGSFFMRFR